MSSVKQHLSKVREERLAREKARIEKLRELNLKKYSKTDLITTTSKLSSSSFVSKNDFKVPSSNGVSKVNTKPPSSNSVLKNGSSLLKTYNNGSVNGVSKIDTKKPGVFNVVTKQSSAKGVSKVDNKPSANAVSKVATKQPSGNGVLKVDAMLSSDDGVSNVDATLSSDDGVSKVDTHYVPSDATNVSKVNNKDGSSNVNGESNGDIKHAPLNADAKDSPTAVSKTNNTKLVLSNGVSKVDIKHTSLNVTAKVDSRPAFISTVTKDIKKISHTLKTDFQVNNTAKRASMVPFVNQRKSIAIGSAVNHRNLGIKNNEKTNLTNTTKPRDVVITHNNTRQSIFKFEKESEKPISKNLNGNYRKSVIGFSMGKTDQKDFKDLISNSKKDFVTSNKKDFISSNKIITKKNKSQISIRQSVAPIFESKSVTKTLDSRKSYQPTQRVSKSTEKDIINNKRQTVFERLYQPKIPAEKKTISDSEKLLNNPSFLTKIIQTSGLILGKGDFCNNSKDISVRRSISAVHFKRMSKSQMNNCVHRWSSIGEKLDKAHLEDIDEDEAVREDKIVSAVKSERKKVKFQTPVSNFNTPTPDELQEKLHSWLKKRGKSIDSFQHLHCFGIKHLTKEFKPLNLPKVQSVDLTPLNLNSDKFEEVIPENKETGHEFELLNSNLEKFEQEIPENIDTEHFEDCLEDEDKENQPLESDSDDDSYNEMMNNKFKGDKKILDGNNKEDAAHKWRRASCISDSVTDLNETQNTTLTYTDSPLNSDDLAMGALNDLTKLLREGYSWEQCAQWLRAIRLSVPAVSKTAGYWECRAELEGRRGDLPASVHCWERACAQGTEPSVVEANLDHLLDKFMQLKISPSSGQSKQPDPKLVDVKNVFKSTLIRFAVQQAKIRRSQELKLIVTPVRRSGRLSAAWSARKGFRPPLTELSSANKGSRTPLVECSTLREAEELRPIFVPNDTLCQTP